MALAGAAAFLSCNFHMCEVRTVTTSSRGVPKVPAAESPRVQPLGASHSLQPRAGLAQVQRPQLTGCNLSSCIPTRRGWSHVASSKQSRPPLSPQACGVAGADMGLKLSCLKGKAPPGGGEGLESGRAWQLRSTQQVSCQWSLVLSALRPALEHHGEV